MFSPIGIKDIHLKTTFTGEESEHRIDKAILHTIFPYPRASFTSYGKLFLLEFNLVNDFSLGSEYYKF